MPKTSTQTSRQSHSAPETLYAPQPETLRHLGFQTIVLPVNGERQSLGPSRFYQLGYCHRGNVSLSTQGQPQVLREFELQAGDLFYLPVGTQYTLSNTGPDFAIVVVATARDGFDIAAEEERKTILSSGLSEGNPELMISAFPDTNEGLGYGTGDMDDDVPHIVLFFDNDGKSSFHPMSVASLFPVSIITREFGVSSTNLPDLSVGVESPLVFRPIVSDTELTH